MAEYTIYGRHAAFLRKANGEDAFWKTLNMAEQIILSKYALYYYDERDLSDPDANCSYIYDEADRRIFNSIRAKWIAYKNT